MPIFSSHLTPPFPFVIEYKWSQLGTKNSLAFSSPLLAAIDRHFHILMQCRPEGGWWYQSWWYFVGVEKRNRRIPLSHGKESCLPVTVYLYVFMFLCSAIVPVASLSSCKRVFHILFAPCWLDCLTVTWLILLHVAARPLLSKETVRSHAHISHGDVSFVVLMSFLASCYKAPANAAIPAACMGTESGASRSYTLCDFLRRFCAYLRTLFGLCIPLFVWLDYKVIIYSTPWFYR